MELNFFSCGEGFPFIILHGLFGSSDNWQTLSRKFAEHFQVFALDQRNHGSSPHNDTFDYQSMAEDLRDFMDAHNLPEAFVLGHSMGGKTAMQFAGIFPERLKKLIVADIAPKAYPPHHAEILEGLSSLNPAEFENRTQMDQALASKIPETAVRQFLLKNVGRDANGAFKWKLNLKAIRENYDRIMSPISFAQPFENPALFIRGAESDYILPGDEPEIKRFFPHAEFVTLQGAGHWLHAEKPTEFFEVARDFLLRD